MAAPVPPDTAELLEGLDRNKLAGGSPELFDALVHGSPKRVRDELTHFPKHPLATKVTAWLVARGIEPPRPPTNDEILGRLGIQDIEAHLHRKDAEISRLRKELADVQERGHSALKAATGYSATTALLAGAAILGWLAAFGVLPFAPQVIPQIDPTQKTEKPDPKDNGVGIEGG